MTEEEFKEFIGKNAVSLFVSTQCLKDFTPEEFAMIFTATAAEFQDDVPNLYKDFITYWEALYLFVPQLEKTFKFIYTTDLGFVQVDKVWWDEASETDFDRWKYLIDIMNYNY
jgi:hypothetical protein